MQRIEIEQFYKDVEALDLKFPVAEIARITGYSKGNVSEYISKKKEPSKAFLKAFYEGFKIVPQGTTERKELESVVSVLVSP